jgi:hypothetical protein
MAAYEVANDPSERLGILQGHHVIRAVNAHDFGLGQQPCRKSRNLGGESTYGDTFRSLADEDWTANALGQRPVSGYFRVTRARDARSRSVQCTAGGVDCRISSHGARPANSRYARRTGGYTGRDQVSESALASRFESRPRRSIW